MSIKSESIVTQLFLAMDEAIENKDRKKSIYESYER